MISGFSGFGYMIDDLDDSCLLMISFFRGCQVGKGDKQVLGAWGFVDPGVWDD